VAYEGLLRALRAGVAKIEDPTDQVDSVRTKTVEPEPVALSVKVVLVGIDELYELLLQTDRRFRKLFKVKAHMQDHVERTDEAAVSLAAELCRIIRQDALPEFDREALAWLVDHSSRLAADQTRLSLEYPLLREIMIEAAALARLNGRKTVGTATLHEARDAQIYRANLFEEEFMADYDREIIKVPTRGEGVGVVNGMSVTFYGDYVFGLPHRIACTVGVGRRGIIDLEREAELGGPIHTKAIMILTSFLLGRFAHDKPLILSGTIHFEQSYAGIEGDSASGAELACLLSALADVPINLSYAFTGAVGHQGDILAVGDVTRKIEGFFKVCKRRGLTGGQGVLLPKDNVDNLMLSAEVIDAVDAGRFHVFPVETIEQAMEILTRHPAGEQHPDGSFTEGSIFARVDARFRELGRLAHAHGVGTSPPQHD
jgi:predicted ATP-dependent protease